MLPFSQYVVYTKNSPNQLYESKMGRPVIFKEWILYPLIYHFNQQITARIHSIFGYKFSQRLLWPIIILTLAMNIYKTQRPICYDCSSTENLKISSQYTAICDRCFNRELAEIQYFKKYRQLDPQIDQITENIYLGNEDAATSKNVLEKHGITAICACGTHLETPFIDDHKYNYKLFEIGDAPMQVIIHLFNQHYRWMQQMFKEGRKVLIHCSAGVSRSASFVIAYLMRQNWLSFDQALQYVRSRRVFVCPNSGFVAQLRVCEAQLKEQRKQIE